MKRAEIIVAHFLAWQLLVLLIIYFLWAAQDTTALPGMTNAKAISLFAVAESNSNFLIMALLGAAPIFYISWLYLTPRLLLKPDSRSVLLYCLALFLHLLVFFVVVGLSKGIFYFTGIPSEVKLALQIVLLSGVGGTIYAYLRI